MLIQVILLAVFLLLLLRILQQRTLGRLVRFLSLTAILLAAYVVIFPDVSNRVAKIAGVGRGADLIIYICMAVGAYLLTALYIRSKLMQLQIARLVQRLAIEKRHIEDLTSNLHASRES